MELMRHSDMRLTMENYLDATLLPIAEAVNKILNWVRINSGDKKEMADWLLKKKVLIIGRGVVGTIYGTVEFRETKDRR